MAPSQTFLRIPLILLLIFPVVSDATNSTSSKNTTKSASESQTNDAAKCLKSLNDVKRELTSTVPPLHGWTTDNYNNISRALFPGVKLPSLYIKVTLQFIVNDTGPGTGKLSDEVLKFTWSQSCIFVSNVCLNATTVFSLGTVYPQRRETDLALSVHKLCEGASKTNGFKNDNETWIYALFGLQDICILPNVSDPRVNTAQCVILGHYGDKDQPFVHPSEWYNYREVWIFFTSILLAITICWYAVNWLNRGNRDQYKNTFLWSVVWLFIFSIVLISVEIHVAFVANCKDRHSHSTKFCFLIVHFVFYFGSFLANVAISHKCPPDGMSVMVPCIYQVAHHLLWVLCAGIPADPSWAIPLFLCECLVIFSLVCATYFFHKANDSRKLVICQLSVSYIAICLAVFTVAISFFGPSVADIPTNNILEIIMVAVLVWAIKNSGLAPGNNDNSQGRPGNGEAIEMREGERRPFAAG